MRLKVAALVVAGLLTSTAVTLPAQAPFPEMGQVRAWIQQYQPKLAVGDSGINAGIVVIDTNAKYVKSLAFRMSDRELATMDPVAHAVMIQDDTTIKAILNSCVRADNEVPSTKALCFLDGARVGRIDHVRFMTGRDLQVMKSDSAARRFGPDAAQGAVMLETNTATLERFTSLGVTAANLVSFETRRTRRSSDDSPVVITVLMLR